MTPTTSPKHTVELGIVLNARYALIRAREYLADELRGQAMTETEAAALRANTSRIVLDALELQATAATATLDTSASC